MSLLLMFYGPSMEQSSEIDKKEVKENNEVISTKSENDDFEEI